MKMDSTLHVTTMKTLLLSKISANGDFDFTTQSFESLRNDSDRINAEHVFMPCNNPENLIDENTADGVLKLFYMSLFPVIEIFGVTTSIINCVVFARQGLKDRINLCLFSLALADISFLLLIFSAKFFSFLGLFDKELEEYWEMKHLGTVLGTMMGTLALSHLMTLIISVERCICVVSPFTAKRILKTRYMAVIIVIVTIYSLGAYSLQSSAYLAVRLFDPLTNTSRWEVRLSDFFLDNQTILIILYNDLLGLTVPCVTLAVVIVTTSVTVIKLRRTLAWRHHNVNSNISAGDRREAAVTKMLTVVCFIYVTTVTPSLTQAFSRTLIPGYQPTGKYCNTFNIIQTLAHLCEVTNSSVNFIVYYTMGSRFRDTVWQLFGTWRKKKEPTAKSVLASDQNFD